MSSTTRRIGHLNVVCREPHPPGKGTAIVLLHGYGADCCDLAPLAEVFPQEFPVNWYFPDAPLALPFGGKAWFPIDLVAFERATQNQNAGIYVDNLPDGMDQALKTLQPTFQTLRNEYRDLVLGGFSQGSMMAYRCSLMAENGADKLVLLSSAPVDLARTQQLAQQHAGLPVFQSHGQQDPILPFAGAEKLAAMWRHAGCKLTFVPFPGGHEIPPSVLALLAGFLKGAN